MMPSLVAPTAKSLLIYVGGVVTTIFGSWVSSKLRIYDDSRKAHLDDIKQKVLIPLRDGLLDHYGPLVSHRSHVVVEKWGIRQRKDNVSVTESPNEDGPLLEKTIPDVLASTDQALFIDAKQRHFRELLEQTEQFLAAWKTYASECGTWVLKLSDEILAEANLPAHPVRHGSPYVMHYRLAVFVYRRLFRSLDFVLHKREPSNWVKGTSSSGWYIDGFDGQPAQGTEQQIDALLSSLDVLMKNEKDTAERILEKARALETHLASVTGELTYAIAARRLHKRCDLVSFF
jgi:hypothetical protein